ncbi:MAG: SDR family NAD(P)-dependent oxidoreductase [Actinobacteria bacterium]|nr:SDR family NAD(P)-dependent oxidoreductase [Actinomycetota bacterium]
MASILSAALDKAVVPGFSRIGYAVRSRLQHWQPLTSFNLIGKTVVITGPTSGLGLETARQLASLGANLVLVARNAEKCQRVIEELAPLCKGNAPVFIQADVADLDQVRTACSQIASQFPRIDVLIHNAGALLNIREMSKQGIEQTIACHVVGPFLMTSLLISQLQGGRVITVSSGGMYSVGLPQASCNQSLQMSVSKYNGTKQYAIAKRAQVTLNEMLAKRYPEIEFVAMHPGWADTPGVQQSIPLFRKLTAPILRTTNEGADTIVWLSCIHPLPGASGTFWSDREVRPTHKTPQSRKIDTEINRQSLWQQVEQMSEL